MNKISMRSWQSGMLICITAGVSGVTSQMLNAYWFDIIRIKRRGQKTLRNNDTLTLVMSTKAVLFFGAPWGEDDERLVWGPSCLNTTTQDGSDQQQPNQQRSNSFFRSYLIVYLVLQAFGVKFGDFTCGGLLSSGKGHLILLFLSFTVKSCFKCEVNKEWMNNCKVHTSIRQTHTLAELHKVTKHSNKDRCRNCFDIRKHRVAR